MTEEVRERRYSTNLGNEEENCRCYCQKKRECERQEPKPASIFDYVYQELTWGQVKIKNYFQNLFYGASRWYYFERLPKSNAFRWAAIESAHIVQSVHLIAPWKSK